MNPNIETITGIVDNEYYGLYFDNLGSGYIFPIQRVRGNAYIKSRQIYSELVNITWTLYNISREKKKENDSNSADLNIMKAKLKVPLPSHNKVTTFDIS